MRTYVAKQNVCMWRKHFGFSYRPPLHSLQWASLDLNALRFTAIFPGIDGVETCIAVSLTSVKPSGLKDRLGLLAISVSGVRACGCCVGNNCHTEVERLYPAPDLKDQPPASPLNFPRMHKMLPLEGPLCLRRLPGPQERAHCQWYSLRLFHQPSLSICPRLVWVPAIPYLSAPPLGQKDEGNVYQLCMHYRYPRKRLTAFLLASVDDRVARLRDEINRAFATSRGEGFESDMRVRYIIHKRCVRKVFQTINDH